MVTRGQVGVTAFLSLLLVGVEDGEANKISRMNQDLSRLPRHLNTERSFNIKWTRREILSVVLLAFFH